MTALLVLLFFGIAVTVEILVLAGGRARRAAAGAGLELFRRAAGGLRFPADVWLHPGHAWARAGPDRTAHVGLDHVASLLAGPLDELRLPGVGERVRRGRAAAVLARGAREAAVPSPVHGIVLGVNEAVARDPALARRDPYGEGWLLRVKLRRGFPGLETLLTGTDALRRIERAAGRLGSRLVPTLGPVLQDGGTLDPGFLDRLDPDEWHDLAADLFRMKAPGKGARR